MENMFIYEHLKGKNLSKVLKVGDEVYIIPQGNMMRYRNGSSFDYAEIVKINKVGRKYFYLENYPRKKFGESCGRICDITEYSEDYQIFLSLNDLEDARINEEIGELSYTIKKIQGNLSKKDYLIIKEVLLKYE